MPNATPTPTQIVIQKIGAVIIAKPNFFLKLITCLTQGKKGKETTLKLEFLICNLKNGEPKIACNEFWGQFWF